MFFGGLPRPFFLLEAHHITFFGGLPRPRDAVVFVVEALVVETFLFVFLGIYSPENIKFLCFVLD